MYRGKLSFKRKIDLPDLNEYKKNYLKISSDISYLKSKWDDFILKSLQDDFELFQDWSKKNIRSEYGSDTKFWSIHDLKSNSFKISKTDSKGINSIYLYVQYSFSISNFNIKIDDITAQSRSLKSIDLKLSKEMIEIVSKYILTVKINDKIRENEHILKSFNDMVEIVGKDIIRDSRIDSILNEI